MPIVKPERGMIRTVTTQIIDKKEFSPPRIEIPFHFNPPELSLEFQNKFTIPEAGKHADAKTPEFGGVEPRDLTLELLFDSYELHTPREQLGTTPPRRPQDVRQYTDKLLELMKPTVGQGNAKWPPAVEIEWGHLKKGKAWTFKAFLMNLKQKFVLFMPDGMPVRAVCTCTFKQVGPEIVPGQNPTSGSLGSERTRLVKPGERLDLIAHEEYGDSTRWREIAEANGLLNVRDLVVGQRLAIPTRQ
jgi:nucleoid-associated protein YgaU